MTAAAGAGAPPPTGRPAASLIEEVRAALPAEDPTVGRFERLVEIVGGLESCVVALSGGIDSSFLVRVASRWV